MNLEYHDRMAAQALIRHRSHFIEGIGTMTANMHCSEGGGGAAVDGGRQLAEAPTSFGSRSLT